jgi:hypothetical protein
MALDKRMINRNSAGRGWDLSTADSFDYSAFFVDMTQSAKLQMLKDEVCWSQVHVKPERPVEVVLNLSCGVQHTPHLMLTQVALFEALGIDFAAVAGAQYCCGRIFQNFGKDEPGRRMAARSIGRFASWRPTTNVQCCGSCFIEFDYHVAEMKEATGRAPFEVVHITDFLLTLLKRLGDKVPWRASPAPCRVLLHAEGAEVHPSKAAQRTAVIETLKLIPNVEYVGLVESPSLGSPCATTSPGGPSVLNDLNPAQYLRVRAELAAQARRAGADMILTHHHLCHREWSKFGSERLPVVHYQSLLGTALGIDIPDRFQFLWQLGDPELVLEKTRPYWESWGIAESAARELTRKHFTPKYAAAVRRCPCEGNCLEAIAGTSSHPS